MNKIRQVVSVIVLNPEGKFVILKRSSDKKVHASLWNCPSGGVEQDETLENASVRETLEETGLRIEDIIIGPKNLIGVSDELSIDITYLLAKTSDKNVILNSENSEYKWVTPSECLDYKFAVNKSEVLKVLKHFNLL